ncbi:hypothetical protein PoB_004633300 [Plakobranchus ocellatus]|uniref:Uncharacterized protein n=1 Tax=Plakobranchus ocellatus TaxID=259542 RepID=A0AAV4BLZ2_9GAST|nr:hypothetical protein PoB_004633300 [Plakobranchus ocellatus]
MHCKSRHPQSQGSVERANGDIKVFCWRGRLAKTQKTGLRASASKAERMVKRNRVDLRAGEQGEDVAVPVPPIDRGRGDLRNILGVIFNRREGTDLYRKAVKAGILRESVFQK